MAPITAHGMPMNILPLLQIERAYLKRPPSRLATSSAISVRSTTLLA